MRRRLQRCLEINSDTVHMLCALRGLTQQELATRMGYATSYICEILGKNKNPSLDTIAAMAEVLGVGYYALFAPIDKDDLVAHIEDRAASNFKASTAIQHREKKE